MSVYGTGTYEAIAAFLGSQLTCFATFISLPFTSSDCSADLPTLLLPRLDRSFHSRLTLSFCVPTVLSICSTGISTCYPSTTTLVLALGPDLPRADQLYSGNLGYSATRILTLFSLLIPAFSLLSSPLLLSVQLLPADNAPLPTSRFRSFGIRTSRLVSYYALFECMAASKPTS